MKIFKILSIDGGGIKGLYSAYVLAEFERYFSTRLTDHFDMICGTSTGGIIAMGIGLGMPMQKIVDLYNLRGPDIFRQQVKERFNLRMGLGDKVLGFKQALFSSKYDGTELKKALSAVFRLQKLDDAANLLCIPSYNITLARTRVFKNGPFGRDGTLPIVDVALATSAAPTYFPIRKIAGMEYIDGGMWANNPTIVGLSEFLCHFLKPWHERETEDYNGVEILSVSSCEKFGGQCSRRRDRSFWRWKDSIFDIYSNGQGQANDYFLETLAQHLDFQLDITRVCHKELSKEQARFVGTDNASPTTRAMLKHVALQTAEKYEQNPAVIKFFQERRSWETAVRRQES